MTFPKNKELKSVRKKLDSAEPSRYLPQDASKADQLKYKLCEIFVEYILDNDITQSQLAKKLKVDPSRINEIVKYRIDLFSVDKLLDLTEVLKLDLKVRLS